MSTDSHLLGDGSAYFDLIIATGVDRLRFLQGQLSCNLDSLTPDHSLRGCLCNLKGRVISNMHVLSDNEQLYLLTPAGMAAAVLTTLARYQVFFKTSLQHEANNRDIRLFACSATRDVPEELRQLLPTQAGQVTRIAGGFCLQVASHTLSVSRFVLIGQTDNTDFEELMHKLNELCSEMPVGYWQTADILAGQAQVRPGQQEKFTPQLLNYDINGTIDFKKGCYTGQEVVARMFYRAEAKRRLGLLKLQSLEHAGEYGLDTHEDIVDHVADRDGILCLVVASTNTEQRHPAIQMFA